MKMNNYRLFLVAIATASCVFLTGFDNDSVAKKQTASVTLKEDQPNNQEKSAVKLKRKKNKHKQPIASVDKTDIEEILPQKPLDLSVPFKLPEKTLLKTESGKRVQRESSNIFANKKTGESALSLDGQMLMSSEPEADKQKSLDGAGIVINIKR